MNPDPFLNPQPFIHHQIKNPTGLFAVMDIRVNDIVSYDCTLCRKSYSTETNSEGARRNFLKHAKSEFHLITVQAMSSLSNDKTSSQFYSNSCTNSGVDDSSHLNSNNTSDSTHNDIKTPDDASFVFFPPLDNDDSITTEDPLMISSDVLSISTIDILKDLFGAHSSNFLYYLHECQKEKSGFKALLCKCLLNNSLLYDAVKECDVSLHFNLLSVLASLSQ
jgi:hypothetical protein